MTPSGWSRRLPGAPAALLDILDTRRGPVEHPNRSEIFGPDRFAQHGRSLAQTHRTAPTAIRSAAFFPRLKDNIQVLRRARVYIGAQARSGHVISPAADWLLDNFHLIESQLKEIHEGLPRRYFRDLPMLIDEPLRGLPRIYGVAWAFVAHTDSAFDEHLLDGFLRAYLQTRELTLGELWALPTTLRVVLVENLRRLAERLATTKAAREVANLVCDRLDAYPPAVLSEMLEALSRRGVGRTFLVLMAQRLHDRPPQADSAQQDWLRQALPDLAGAQLQQSAEQAADNLSVSNAIGSLRGIGNADWSELICQASPTIQRLLSCPVFAAERSDTRDDTLHAIERLARRSGHSELHVAQTLLERVSGAPADGVRATPGHWLQGPGRPALMRALGLTDRAARTSRWLSRHAALPAYLLTLLGGTAGWIAWVLWHHGALALDPHLAPWLVGLTVVAMLFPASEAVVAVLNRLISESVRPSRLPRLALGHGIPPEHRVMVAIPGMLSSPATVDALAHRLELHHLANPEPCAQFALLTDWLDADQASEPGDAVLLDRALERIRALNRRHPVAPEHAPRFILLHRPRTYSPTERRWIGWERKRGKLEQLFALLAGGCEEPGATPQGRFVDLAECSAVQPATRYVVTLDADTQLPPGRLRELVGVAAHPRNQPEIDPLTRTVCRGYGILQPRVVTPLPAPSETTLFHWLFAGQSGVDPYSTASSEIYQDVFGEGTFTGKGLMNVQAMHAVLSRRLPEGLVLSHDLLEGALARCAAVTDIVLIEDAPFRADVAASRVHRWTRGDWQLLPILCQPRRYALRPLHAWKMLDNLRRSLVAPMSLALLWLAAGAGIVDPLVALAVVTLAWTAGPVMGGLAGLAPAHENVARWHFYRTACIDLWRAGCLGVWQLVQLLSLARWNLDAIARALWRMAVSRRHLLAWTTADAAQASISGTLADTVRRHRLVPLLALTLAAAGWLGGTARSPLLGALLCAVWAVSPLATWWSSRARGTDPAAALEPHERAYFEGIARATWRLFERCVDAQEHHLPPDNLQLSPHTLLASRTSPTNIGLYLLSVACARAFGWIGTLELVRRLDATLQTLDQLPRHRGHFLNWYDTRSLAALAPMYVSTVDSGNLSGHLLAVAQACRELAQAPGETAAALGALQASAERLAAHAGDVPGHLREDAWLPLLATPDTMGPGPALADRLDALARAIGPRWAAERPDDAQSAAPAPVQRLALLVQDHLSTLGGLAEQLREHARVGPLPDGAAPPVSGELEALAQRCEALAWSADYGFLYNRRRRLFHIGYRVAEQQLDTSFYDLLASESRLASLLAIAKADVPVSHWSALGRPFYAAGADAGLRSWSGSMFEYLMPTLILDEPHGSVLHQACRAAVHEQMAFAQGHGVPWGISESAYAASDQTLAYQYAPQGVPRLALRRTPPDELVIAPYATALAAQLDPRRAARNWRCEQALGARGRYGFIEALDYTAARQIAATVFTPVVTFMAHHQGMTVVALANVLLGAAPRRWGMANARIEAVASLLHERPPREVSVLQSPPADRTLDAPTRRRTSLLREVVPGMSAVAPTHLLANGRYSVALRDNGAGTSRWGDVNVSRSRDDALRDARGSFFYLRWDRQPQAVSLTQHPAPDPAAHYQSTYHADRMSFDAVWAEVTARTTVWVSPEDDIEFRQVTLHNVSDRALDLELLSAFEIALADERADASHPAFSNLFLRAAWRARQQALVFERTPRLATEPGLHAAHFLATADAPLLSIRVQTSRSAWLGRNRDASQPAAHYDTLAAPGSDQVLTTGLDPMCALAVRLQLPPGAQVTLTFCTAVCDNAERLDAVMDKHCQLGAVERASLMSATLAGIRLRTLDIQPEEFAAIQTLTTAVVMNLARVSAVGAADLPTAPAHCDRRLLWRFGISGDRPILLVYAATAQSVGMLRALSKALQVWSWSCVACDVVVINNEPASYLMELQREARALHELFAAGTDRPAAARISMTVLRAEDVGAPEMDTLRSLARLQLHADGRPLTHHMQEWSAAHDAALEARQNVSISAVPVAAAGVQRAPRGRFDGATGEFKFPVQTTMRPARPWANVLANPGFGTQVTEAGGGYTWALNSRLNQLTPWSNDPVADPPGEWFLIQDLKSRDVWSVSPSAWSDPSVTYHVTHGQGYTVIHHRHEDLDVQAVWCVDPDRPVKQIGLRLVNRGSRTLQLRVVGMAEWIMGADRADRRTTQTACFTQRLAAPAGGDADDAGGARRLVALTCTQLDHAAGFGAATGFLALAGPVAAEPDWSCDRRECFDARGRLVVPDTYEQRSGWGLDPCAALATRIVLPAGRTAHCDFLLGFGLGPEQARHQATESLSLSARDRLARSRSQWDRLLGATTVATPDPLFDAMVNRWLLYQTVACRLWAKAGLYQAGGAYGFRDQLQDAMALAWADPAALRAQIVLNAGRQFPQGDVQHWWHAPTGAGVRTHFSDDLLWLPHACAHYLRCTQDATLWDEAVNFIEGPPVPAGAEDAYYVPTASNESATIYEHCARAIDRSLAVGGHGLPLMGTGDWNDGMNRVGAEGRGESVWLGWFLCQLVDDLAPVARARGQDERAGCWERAARGWRAALEQQGWDGAWYRRAFFDDGSALGSRLNAECRIDLIAQSWAVLSGVAPAGRQRESLASADALLVEPANGLIKLLTPALQTAHPSAGYIQAYPPGVRENGGQYSHAAVWALIAHARLGDGDTAYRYFTYLSPAHRAAHPQWGPVYEIEPYVMAGDVSGEVPYVGRGGWSWYTGSAAWLHRAAIEHLFGLRQIDGTLSFTPCLPRHWPRAELTLRRDGRTLRVIVCRHDEPASPPTVGGPAVARLDVGERLDWQQLPLEHSVVLRLPLRCDAQVPAAAQSLNAA